MLTKEEQLRKTYLEGLLALKKEEIIEAYRACEEIYVKFLEKDDLAHWNACYRHLNREINDYLELRSDLRSLLLEEENI